VRSRVADRVAARPGGRRGRARPARRQRRLAAGRPGQGRVVPTARAGARHGRWRGATGATVFALRRARTRGSRRAASTRWDLDLRVAAATPSSARRSWRRAPGARPPVWPVSRTASPPRQAAARGHRDARAAVGRQEERTGVARRVDSRRLSWRRGVAWEPPPALSVDRPWMRCARTWVADGPGGGTAAFRLELERGAGATPSGKERLTATDEAFSSLYSPLILSPPRRRSARPRMPEVTLRRRTARPDARRGAPRCTAASVKHPRAKRVQNKSGGTARPRGFG